MSTSDQAAEQPTTNNKERGLGRRVLEKWRRTNDWLKALFIALLVLGFMQLFILRWVSVRSTSMYATLLPGDLVGVTRWNTWTGIDHGDIVVFRDPLQDARLMGRRQLLVKRVVGLPGDVVELHDGQLLVNNQPVPDFPKQTESWLVRLKGGASGEQLLNDLGLQREFLLADRDELELPLNDEMASALRERPEVVSVERLRLATGAPRHIFPYSPYYKWNSDDYGPIIVPRKNDHVRIDARTLPLYDRLITHYEHNKLEGGDAGILINGSKADSYVIQQDYYFVLGDSRHYSDDSRYWGFLPADHLVGRAAFVLLSTGPDGKVRGDRWFARP